MRHRSIVYPVCRVDLVELEPGESFRFSQKAASASYGVFALGGTRSAKDAVETTDPELYNVTKMTMGTVPGRMFNKVGQWVPNDRQNGWANDELGHEEMVITAGEQGARWICLGRVDGVECRIRHQAVHGLLTLPRGWGMIGVRGNINFDNRPLSRLGYLSPKNIDLCIQGRGDILLFAPG